MGFLDITSGNLTVQEFDSNLNKIPHESTDTVQVKRGCKK